MSSHWKPRKRSTLQLIGHQLDQFPKSINKEPSMESQELRELPQIKTVSWQYLNKKLSSKS